MGPTATYFLTWVPKVKSLRGLGWGILKIRVHIAAIFRHIKHHVREKPFDFYKGAGRFPTEANVSWFPCDKPFFWYGRNKLCSIIQVNQKHKTISVPEQIRSKLFFFLFFLAKIKNKVLFSKNFHTPHRHKMVALE